LLSLSRAESGQARLSTEVVDLQQLATQVVGHLGVLAEEKRQVLEVSPGPAPRCVADRSMLRQALINLVDNAIKYTPDGGAITLRLSEHDQQAVVEVTDTGVGVAAEAADRIFERFYRGPEAAAGPGPQGLGLGLAIAKWAAEVNGGSLVLQRNPAGGSTFRLELPRAAAA
jgi:signal transduction histidine kinase